MAGAFGGQQGRPSTGKSRTHPSQFISGFSSASSTGKTTIRLTDIYNPKPQPAKTTVRIRPPSPIVPSPAKSPELRRSLSSDPPTSPIIRRRAQSLPSSTERKREAKVRFVDSMGLELEEVKVFKVGERPQIPPHVKYRLLMSSELAFGKSLELSLPHFKPCFCDNKGAQSDFLKCVQSQRVCLEQVQCSELGISGTIQVLNLAFEKKVRVQYSFTNWRTCTETMASWVSTICRGEPDSPDTDIFCFRLPVPAFILQPGAVLEFAISYEVEGCTYWDNNDGRNYKLSCHSYKVTVPREIEDSLLHFT